MDLKGITMGAGKKYGVLGRNSKEASHDTNDIMPWYPRWLRLVILENGFDSSNWLTIRKKGHLVEYEGGKKWSGEYL